MTNASYFDDNREQWNQRTHVHLQSEFYDLDGWKAGQTSLKSIELTLLGDVRGQRILHLQCHFGQDTLSLARMGAEVTGVDLSDVAIATAQELAAELDLSARFLVGNVLALDDVLGDDQFDLIFTSYGVIGWLPELTRWGQLIHRYLRPGGRLILVEFHPYLWMYDDELERITYSYFNAGVITEAVTQTYTDGEPGRIQATSHSWNHPLSDVLTALINPGLRLMHFAEYDYSPYNLFADMVAVEGGYQLPGWKSKFPLVYSLVARKD